MGGEGLEPRVHQPGLLRVVGDVDEGAVFEGRPGAQVLDVVAHGHADLRLALVAEHGEGEGDAAAMVEAEDEDVVFAGELQDRGQVVLPAGVGRLGLGVEAQDAVAGEGGDGLFGGLLGLDQFDRAGPFADREGFDEIFFDADAALAPAALGVGLGFGALFGGFWLVFGLFHEGKAKHPKPIGNQRLGRAGKKR
ncbi:MAG: hypothetical protein RL592_600 [Verrucomicrobiota bacterium]